MLDRSSRINAEMRRIVLGNMNPTFIWRIGLIHGQDEIEGR